MNNTYYGVVDYARVGISPYTKSLTFLVKMSTAIGERKFEAKADGRGSMERSIENILRQSESESIGQLRGKRVEFTDTADGSKFVVLPEDCSCVDNG